MTTPTKDGIPTSDREIANDRWLRLSSGVGDIAQTLRLGVIWLFVCAVLLALILWRLW